MVNLKMKIFQLLPFNRRLVSPKIPVFTSQRYNYKMTSVYHEQCTEKPNINIISKRNAISWNPLKKSLMKSRLQYIGSLLYESIADNIDYNKFFQKFDMEDTLNSWFLITEVHVWMLALRIMQEEERGKDVRNHFIEAMWNDVKIRSKKLGIVSTSLMNQQLELLSEQFNASLIAYDESILSSDIVLANHIWNRFFKCKTNDPTQLEELVRYVRQQVNLLSKTPTTNIISEEPTISWISI